MKSARENPSVFFGERASRGVKALRSSRLLTFRSSSFRSRGAALIVVLWISLGLASLALLFGNTMMLEYRAADNTAAALESTQAIEGARSYVSFVLANLEEPGKMPDVESYESDDVAVGDAAFWLIGRGGASERESRGEDDAPVFGLVDEASKLNLNTATREMLEALPGMTAELAAAIIDWRDADEELTPDGAESQNYLLGDPAYNCKNSRFETVEELRLVKGGDWNVLCGEDANRNGILDPNENDGAATPPDDNQDGRLDPGILEYVTVYTREPNVREDGSPRINVNGNRSAVEQLLREKFGDARAAEIQAATGSGGNFSSILQFFLRSRMTPEEFAQVNDALTATDNDALEGLVNVNTAGAEVLACLPGIGEAFAEQLTAYREGKDEELDSPAWVTKVLDEPSAIEAGPYITARTSQFSADAAAVGHEGRGLTRTLLVFDASGEEPAVVYRRDLTGLGWPLGRSVRERLAADAKERTRLR